MNSPNVFTFGIGKSGELGNNLNNIREILPFRVPGLINVIQVSNGGSFSLCLDHAGRLYFFGKSKNGRGGYGSDTAVPRAITQIPRIAMIACGYWHSLILTEDRNVMASGYNSHGQLGLGNTQEELQFVSTNFQGKYIKAGGHASFVITDNNDLFSAGIRELNGFAQDKLNFNYIMQNVEFVDCGIVHVACISNHQLYT